MENGYNNGQQQRQSPISPAQYHQQQPHNPQTQIYYPHYCGSLASTSDYIPSFFDRSIPENCASTNNLYSSGGGIGVQRPIYAWMLERDKDQPQQQHAHFQQQPIRQIVETALMPQTGSLLN
ncbi:unnamed protein product [Gongylonema pulchrum]|uniref:Uncharacterized protein n=1 Tax=Gongylonema pulchrum TaxID=637853 RepID=A0A183EM60_9BILA|nr:unnamed protein product [Gongylonema pulchrum]